MLWAIFVYLLTNLFVLGLGTGMGFLLHWILPAVDLGVGILIGVVTSSISIYFFARLSSLRDELEDEALAQELRSRLTDHPIELVPVKRNRKRKTPRQLNRDI